MVVDPIYRETQKAFYEKYGSDVHYEYIWRGSHSYNPEFAQKELKYLLPRVPGSGFSSSDDVKEEVKDWKSRGTIYKFDQMPYVRKALATLYSESSVDHFLDTRPKGKHALDHKGYLYQPDACKQKKCNLQLVLHGCFNDAEKFLGRFGPMGAANDIILLAP